jgi:hypothetical protein
MLTAILVALLALPSAALAKGGSTTTSSGVHLDPGSPAAKQYSIPLSNARGSGGGGGGSSSSLFGSGITSSSGPSGGAGSPAISSDSTASNTAVTTPSTTASAHRHLTGKGTHRHPAPSASTSATSAAPAASTPPAAKVLNPSSGSGIAWMLGLAAVVIVIGLGGALFVIGRDRRAAVRAVKRSA